MLEKTPLTLEELVLRMLQETNGLEMSTTGLIINSIRTLEYTLEKVLQKFQTQDILSKRWRVETTAIVYLYNPPPTKKEEVPDDDTASTETD